MPASTTESLTRVAAVQAESKWFDLQAGVKKTCSLISDAAKCDAQLIAFPECFIPGYPAWIWDRPMDPDLGVKYIQNSLKVDSPEMGEIRATAAASNINVVLGFSENDNNSLYMAQVTISGQTGEIMMKRRKFKPTHMERTIFGDASGDSLMNVVELSIGKVGALNCWEHIQPLLKYHTFTQGEAIHVSAWPPLEPFVLGSPGHWGMSREGSHSTAQQYAVEGGCFVIHCTGVMSQDAVDLMKTKDGIAMHQAGGGCSAVYAPDGRRLSEWLPEKEEGLVFADLDSKLNLAARMFVDACGHYSRPDLLWLGVDANKRKHALYHGTAERQVKSTSKTEHNEDTASETSSN